MRLVEEAGEPLSAGWLSRVVRTTGLDSGVLSVGDREVDWELTDDEVNVTHAPADGRRAALRYSVGLVFTDLPSGGSRWWWSCPACHSRVDALYLPSDRDRLACRKCCGLLYRSQYPRQKCRRRKRPSVVVITREQKEGTAATGWVLVAQQRVRP
jgi:hypothetical protein